MTRQWMEQVMPDGRKYLYNPETGERTWEDASIPPRSSASTGTWVEMTSQASGKKYYYNTLTKESVWDLNSISLNSSSINNSNSNNPNNNVHGLNEMEKEHRERVFIQLLADKGVSQDWTWERTLKEIISHPDYRAVPTLAERKLVWEKYISGLKLNSSQLIKDKLERCQVELFSFLDLLEIPSKVSFYDIKSSLMEFPKYSEILSKFNLPESEFARIFSAWEDSLEERKQLERKQKKSEARSYLKKIIEDLILTISSKWLDHKENLLSEPKIKEYLALKALSPKEVLYAFEDAIPPLVNDAKKENLSLSLPKIGGKSVEEMLAIIKKELSVIVGIEPNWSLVFSHLLKLGILDELIPSLSFPSQILNIYWNVLEANQALFQKERPIIENIVKHKSSSLDNERAFIDYCKRKEDVSTFSCSIYYRNHYQKAKSEKKDIKSAPQNVEPTAILVEDSELRNKKIIHIFKYSLKHNYNPPITTSSNWEDFAPLITMSTEYNNLPDRNMGRYYFEKYKKYLIKKESSTTEEKFEIPDDTTLEEGEVINETTSKRFRY